LIVSAVEDALIFVDFADQAAVFIVQLQVAVAQFIEGVFDQSLLT
jgi:hypothetical protein